MKNPKMITRMMTLLLLLSLIVPNVILGENISSRLQIHVPHSLFKEEGYDHREALFGIPPYGGSIAQNVYYADSTLCDPSTVDTRSGYPTRSKDKKKPGKMEPWPSPYILMVDRGDCSFVQKVRNAQRSGAAGVIIADNACLCTDTTCITNNPSTECQNREPIMADDGSGGDISIPSFLMFKVDADLIKDYLQNNKMVQIEMTWALPSPDDRVEYDLWTVPSDYVSKDFLKTFKDVAVALGDRAYFTPRMYIYDGIKSGCQGVDGKSQCFNLCTNNGRYCATDPDSNLDEGISGADVVTESLRRICIWRHYGESDGIGVVWWDYVMEFLHRCDTPDFFTNDDCIQDVYNHAGVDKAMIDRCIRDSGGLDDVDSSSNSFLDLELHAQTRRGVVIIPTVFVNTVALRGAVSIPTVFNAICAGFVDGTKPKICLDCAKCSHVLGCIKNGGQCTEMSSSGSGSSSSRSRRSSGGGISATTFTMSLLLVCGLFAGVAFWHWQKTREEMREQVRGILAEYMPLEDGGGNGGDGSFGFAKPGLFG